MNSICLFEAGGTKTSLLIDQSGKLQTIDLPGFNPNRYSPEFENELQKTDLPQNAQIIFYGSGLVSEANKEIVRAIFLKKNRNQVLVFDDQLGAARAAYNDSPGLIGIMGTGAFAAWYNGKELENRKGGYGYLIDDIGGGLELGKIIISTWLNNDLPEDVNRHVSEFIKIKKEDFTTEFYKAPDLNLLASVPKVISEFTNHPEITKLLTRYFDLFFERHISPIVKIHNTGSISLIGSIAVSFENFIRLSAEKQSMTINQIVKNPAMKLLDYHRWNR